MILTIAKHLGRTHGHVEHHVGEVAAPIKAAYQEGLAEVRGAYVDKELDREKREALVELIIKQMTA